MNRNQSNSEKFFRFDDPHQAAAITFRCKIEPLYEETVTGRVLFRFPATPEVISALADYQAGANGNLSEFSRIAKGFLSEIGRRRYRAGGGIR